MKLLPSVPPLVLLLLGLGVAGCNIQPVAYYQPLPLSPEESARLQSSHSVFIQYVNQQPVENKAFSVGSQTSVTPGPHRINLVSYSQEGRTTYTFRYSLILDAQKGQLYEFSPTNRIDRLMVRNVTANRTWFIDRKMSLIYDQAGHWQSSYARFTP